MAFVVTYDGFVSGSYGGRDDGHPEQKVVLVQDLADAAEFATKTNVKLYALNQINFDAALKARLNRDSAKTQAETQKLIQEELAELNRLRAKYPTS